MAEHPNIIGVVHTELNPYVDNRGSFTKVIDSVKLKTTYNLEFKAQQTMISRNLKKGTIRGMHYQAFPIMETKIVSCTEGRILDVIVDLRPSSPTYMKIDRILLDAKDPSILIIPAQCAHGFQTIEDNSNLIYSSNVDYKQELDVGINPMSVELKDIWQLEPTEISARDLKLPTLNEFSWLKYY